MTTLYYIFPFGENADDLTTIPQAPTIDGSVSYSDGWTPPYEYDLLTNPAALPIPRGQMNQLFFDITNNIQEYQQFGSPNWITSADNGGVPFMYPIYARVYYLGQVYENQVANNIVTPGTDTSWLQISGNAQGIVVGQVIDYSGVLPPTGYLLCDGSAVSRTTYANLLAVYNVVQTGTITTGMNTVSGLSDTTQIYIGEAVEGANIPPGTTVATIVDANNITLSANATGSATEPLTFFVWGNGDGSTTFNVPDLRRKTTIGSGGTPTTLVGSKTGKSGGTETQTLTGGNLPAITNVTIDATFLTNVLQGGSGASVQSVGPVGAGLANTNLRVAGGGQAFSIMQPSAVMTKCVKY